MSVDDVVTALAAQLATGMAGTAISGRIFAYAPDTLNPPTAIVLPAASDFVLYDQTFDGSSDYSLTVKVIMGSQDDRSGQAELLSYFDRSGSTSIYAAINSDRTIASTVAMITSIRGTSYGDVEWGGVTFFGAEIAVECGT